MERRAEPPSCDKQLTSARTARQTEGCLYSRTVAKYHEHQVLGGSSYNGNAIPGNLPKTRERAENKWKCNHRRTESTLTSRICIVTSIAHKPLIYESPSIIFNFIININTALGKYYKYGRVLGVLYYPLPTGGLSGAFVLWVQ